MAYGVQASVVGGFQEWEGLSDWCVSLNVGEG